MCHSLIPYYDGQCNLYKENACIFQTFSPKYFLLWIHQTKIIHTVYVSAGLHQITPHNYPVRQSKSHEIWDRHISSGEDSTLLGFDIM